MKLTAEQKEANKLARKQEKEAVAELARITSEKCQRPVKSITIKIEWKKSRMWGSNPNCEAVVRFKDGNSERSETFTASGCGYDKESTVVAQVFNAYLKYKLWNLPTEKLKGGNGSNDKGTAPYGILLYTENHPHFGGGIGMSCYPAISEYIGGKLVNVASGKTFDVYEYTDND